jgi:hypothetical protein
MTEHDAKLLQDLADHERWSDLLQAVNHQLQRDPGPRTAETTRILFLHRGAANLGLGNPREAISDFTTVIEHGAKSGTPWYSRGAAFLVFSNNVNGPEQIFLLRRCLIDLDEALFRDPSHARSASLRKKVAPLLGESPESSAKKWDYWVIAKNVAQVVGSLVGSAIKA